LIAFCGIAGGERVEMARVHFEEMLHGLPRRVAVFDEPVPMEMQAVVHDRHARLARLAHR
jgi:hypothetical protein